MIAHFAYFWWLSPVFSRILRFRRRSVHRWRFRLRPIIKTPEDAFQLMPFAKWRVGGKVSDPLSTDPLSTIFENVYGKPFIWLEIENSMHPSVCQGVPVFVVSKMIPFRQLRALLKNRSICLSHKLHFWELNQLVSNKFMRNSFLQTLFRVRKGCFRMDKNERSERAPTKAPLNPLKCQFKNRA